LYSGELCAIMGLEGFDIGDTVADFENPEGLPGFKVDEPTMSMLFTINTSPFFGKEGEYVTSRHLRDRLFKEIEKNLAMRVEETNSPDKLLVYGRGILHIGILVETMRREGYEFQLGQPQVIMKEIDGERCEPVEMLTVQVPEEFSSKVIDLVSRRKGELTSVELKGDRVHIEFNIPARGIIGLRNPLLTATEGEAIIAHRFKGYEPYKGELGVRRAASIISQGTGTAIAFSINKLQDRGQVLRGSGRRGVRRSSDRREPQDRRPRGERVEGQAAHQHARQRQRQQREHRSCGEVLLGRVHGVHHQRRVPGGDPQEPAHAQDPAGRERPEEGREGLQEFQSSDPSGSSTA
jgi:GTP-binding protein TypA/BipA